MSDDKQVLTEDDVAAEQLVAWTYDAADGGSLRSTFDTGDFATGLALVNKVGEVAEATDHHPDVVLTYPSVSIQLSSHDVGGVTARDVRMARSITEHAAGLGVTPHRDAT